MASFVLSILNSSANKLESISKTYKLEHTEYPPPYDSMQPSNSWTLSDKSAKPNVDRHSISQGMKLVSIAADEYEEGNESMALDIYLTGVDKILMALPNKTDINARMAIKEKLLKVEERVGKKTPPNQRDDANAAPVQSLLLSRLTSSISTKEEQPSMDIRSSDPMTKFKQFGRYMIDFIVSCAILIKQSPIPDFVAFIFGYLLQLFFWVDAQYHIKAKIQDFAIYCIKYGIEADEKYHLHEYITEGIYMTIVAVLKAVVAFKEAPRYKGSPNNTTTEYQNVVNRSQQQDISSPSIQKQKATSWISW